MSIGITNGKIVATAIRRAFIINLRVNGNGYKEIVEQTVEEFGVDRLPNGFDVRYAYKDVKRELDRLRKEISENISEIRQLELRRLDVLLKAMMDQVEEGTKKISQGATDRILRIMKRRADLLGYDAPRHIKIDDWRSDLIQLIRENQMSYSQLVEQFGNSELADELFLEAGVNTNVPVIAEDITEDIIEAEFVEAE